MLKNKEMTKLRNHKEARCYRVAKKAMTTKIFNNSSMSACWIRDGK